MSEDNNTGEVDPRDHDRQEPRSKDEILDVDYITIDELRKLHPRAKPLPPEHEIDDTECHNCGQPWNDDWKERKIPNGPSLGEDWKYKCPNCGFETFECGT